MQSLYSHIAYPRDVKVWEQSRGGIVRFQQGRGAATQVKKVAGVSAPADSCVVNGVVGRKNVTHKAMRRRIASPRVLLLGGALEFHRTQSRLASFEAITPDQVWRRLGVGSWLGAQRSC